MGAGSPAADTGALPPEPPPFAEHAPPAEPLPLKEPPHRPQSSSPPHELRTTSAIEPATGPGEVDEFDVTEGYETGSAAATTSVTSSIYAHTYENGRRYHHFKNGRYPIPNDDLEQNREDMKHAMLLELNDGELYFAPIGDYPQKILDIGTGTG